jgi:hypothetical protein
MSTINRRASKRRKRRPERAFHTPSASEERHLHQAIQNSKLDRSTYHGDLHFIPPWKKWKRVPWTLWKRSDLWRNATGSIKLCLRKVGIHTPSVSALGGPTYDATDGVECVGFLLDIAHVEVISESTDASHRPC